MMSEISFATDFGSGFGSSENTPAPVLESVEEGRALEKFDTVVNGNPAYDEQRASKEKKQKKKSKKKKSKKSSSSKGKGEESSSSSLGSRGSSAKLQDSIQDSINTKVTATSTEQGSSWVQDDEWLSSSFLQEGQKWPASTDPMQDTSSVGQMSDGDAKQLDAMKVFGSLDRKERKRRSETSSSLHAAASKIAAMDVMDAFDDFYDDDHHLHHDNNDLLLQDSSTNDNNRKPAFVEVQKSGLFHEKDTWTDDFSEAELSKFEAFATETAAQSPRNGYGDASHEKESINHTLINYLTAMGLDGAKATDVASSFMSQQKQARGECSKAAAHASREDRSRKPAPVNPDAFAHKMREIEQNQTLSDFNRRTSGSAPKRASRAASTASAAPTPRAASVPLGAHLQGGGRRTSSTDDMPTTTRQGRRTSHASSDDMASTNTGHRQGRRTSFSSSDDMPPTGRQRRTSGSSSMAAAAAAVTAAFDVIRAPSRTASTSGGGRASRRTRAPRMTYERAERPGAVEVSGRAFGAPRRPTVSSLTPSNEEGNDEPMMAIEAMAVEDFDKLGGDNEIVAVRAKPLSLKHALKEKSLRRVIICGLILAAAAVVGTVSFFMTRPDPEPSTADVSLGEASVAPSLAPTFIDNDILVAAATVSGWGYRGPNEAQLQAVGWFSAVDDMDNNDKFGPAFAQRYAMVVFYFSTNGHNWLNQHSWLDPSKHECDWSEDLICSRDSTNRRILTGFDSPRNGLSGSLPSEVFTLRAIDSLVLSKNDIAGSIPSNIHQMTRLQAVDFSSNQLTGPLPETIGGAADIVNFDISENQITGTIPESFFDLTLLRTLDLSLNNIGGTISDSIANLQVLDTLNLKHNRISGQYPQAVNDMLSLDHIWLDYNELTGNLPVISAQQVNRLEITLSNNKITGRIGVGQSVRRHLQAGLTFRIQKLDLSNNQLTGTVGGGAAIVPTLRYLDVSGNSLEGTFPDVRGWPALEHMSLGRNNFTGPIPHKWPPTLEYFDVAENKVTGTIPSEFCFFPNLKFLKLCDNPQLEGTIPSCFDHASNLQHLEIQDNIMDGTLPWELSQLTNMQYLDMSGNAMTGTIPTEFGQLTEMKMFDVHNNQLHGSIPSGFADMRYLKELDLSGNTLTGMLPEGLGKLTKLEEVMFAPGNDWLRGRIPDGWCLSGMNLSTTAVGCNIECSCCHDTESCGAGN